MTLRLGRPRVALIVAPHPDDEVIGAAHLIARLRQGGCRVLVVIVSNGAASHPASITHPRHRLIAERRRESRRALHRLGVTAGAVGFLDLPDGDLSNPGSRCGAALRQAVARIRDIDLIVGPDRRDSHPDHRAVAAALDRARSSARRLQYRVWPPHRSRSPGRSTVVGSGHAAKRSLIAVYRTQMGAIRDDPAGFAIAQHEVAVFAHPIERLVEARR